MIHRNNRSPLTAWLAMAALCLLLAAPATATTAAPADVGPSGSFLGWAVDWWSDLTDGWSAITAGSEAAPNADPDGFAAAPPPDGDLSTAQTPQGDGEVAPDADPDG